MMNTTTDILKYFMRFASKDGVLKNFEHQEGKVPGYADLKDYVTALPEVSLLPDIKHFMFGVDDKMIEQRLKSMDGVFMFFEYDKVTSSPKDRTGLRSTQMEYGITIGHSSNSRNWNMAEHHLVMSACENICKQLITLIEAEDEDKCAQERLLSEGYSLVPLDPVFLYNNIGWILRVTRSTNLFV